MTIHKLNKSITASILLFTLFIFFGCSDDDNPANSESGGSAKIEGRVTGISGFSKINGLQKTGGIEGAAVTVAKVQSNGSLSTVSKASVTTNAEGKFAIETNSINEKYLVVVAKKGSAEWKAVVSAAASAGSTTYCPPVSDETTAEAEVYARIVADGKSNIVSYADIQYYVDSKVAAEIKGNAALTSQIAATLNAEAEAKAKAFSNAYFGTSSSVMQAVNNAKAEAQVQLEASLYAAGESQSSYDAAFNAYQQAVINAYVNAGVEKSKCAKIIQISTAEMFRASTSLSGEARLAIRKSSARRKAYACRKAAEEECDSAGVQPAQKNTVISAGVTLDASINSASSVDDIEAAFAAYHDAVVAQLKLALSAHATAITTVDSSINSSSGLRTVLLVSLVTAANTDAVVNAYITFYNSVKTLVAAELSAATSAQVNAAVEILLLTNS